MVEQTEIKIRKLKRKDRVTVTNLIKKLVDKVGDMGLLDIISSETKSPTNKSSKKSGKKEKEPETTSPVKIGMKVVQLAMQSLQEDVTEWFSDLVGMTPAEFDEGPLDIEVQIIAQLREAEEVSDFFSGASLQFSEIRQLLKAFTKKKEV